MCHEVSHSLIIYLSNTVTAVWGLLSYFVEVSMKIQTMVLMTDRLHPLSTQIYLEHIEEDVAEFFVPIGDYTKPIGYLKFKQIAKKGCFELSSLESLDYPNPHPQFSLSGVLYSRQAALEANRAISAYQQAINQIDPP